ncbi:hypothetical protein CEXT_316381 [Caerostris extrusa]|uniref:Uncharacterized protein n=1 Tax=Caerostris extrusa TaxID=172846 RepID=A0AAV4VLC4_CAEEX|nr:hypothetical protein CEXT_316381 [Caerostris extrusa]
MGGKVTFDSHLVLFRRMGFSIKDCGEGGKMSGEMTSAPNQSLTRDVQQNAFHNFGVNKMATVFLEDFRNFTFCKAESNPPQLIYGQGPEQQQSLLICIRNKERHNSEDKPSLFAPGLDSCFRGPEKLIRKQKLRKTGNIKWGKQSPESSFRVAGPGPFDRPRWLCPDSLYANERDCVLTRAP